MFSAHLCAALLPFLTNRAKSLEDSHNPLEWEEKREGIWTPCLSPHMHVHLPRPRLPKPSPPWRALAERRLQSNPVRISQRNYKCPPHLGLWHVPFIPSSKPLLPLFLIWEPATGPSRFSWLWIINAQEPLWRCPSLFCVRAACVASPAPWSLPSLQTLPHWIVTGAGQRIRQHYFCV